METSSFVNFRWAQSLALLIGLITLAMQPSCLTPGEKQVFKDDIARLQAQMVEVENALGEQGKTISTRSNQHAASTNTRIDGLVRDIQKIQGEIDTLRVGVITGQMPGINPENEGSVARTLETLQERLQDIEEAQEKIMSAIEQAAKTGTSTQSQASTNQRSTKITNLQGLERAFTDQRFRHVAENGAAVVRVQKSKSDRERALYLYAESLYKLGNLREAALKFNEYLDLNPSKHIAHAKMRLGDCFRHLGDAVTAKLFYEDLITSHKGTSEAKTAEERLSRLNL